PQGRHPRQLTPHPAPRRPSSRRSSSLAGRVERPPVPPPLRKDLEAVHFLRKIGFYLVALWAAVTLNFFIPRLLPGSPVDAVLAKLALRGPVSPHTREAIEVMLGADTETPIHLENLASLRGLLTGDLGVSVTYFPTPVAQLVRQ